MIIFMKLVLELKLIESFSKKIAKVSTTGVLPSVSAALQMVEMTGMTLILMMVSFSFI